jgi:transposase
MEFLAHLRKSRRQALRQRAEILPASVVYTPVYQIALIFRTDESYVRKVIHAFNESGFESLNPKVGTGRPRTFEQAIRERIVAIALAPPTTVGEPLTHWSPRRLKDHLERHKIVPSISDAALKAARKKRHIPAHTNVEA